MEILMRIVPIALLCVSFLVSGLASAKDYRDEFDTLWESLWSQGGSPQEIVRWAEGPVKYRYFGVNLNVHRSHMQRALAAASEFSGVKFEDVSDLADADKVAQFHIEIVANNGDVGLATPCYVQTKAIQNWQLQNVALRMRDDSAYRCNFHEMMHAMGVRGHPSGKTVLSYFRPRDDIFLDLDQTMLRAWYSPEMRAGMTPFEAIAVLTQSYIQESPDNASETMIARQSYLSQTIADMQNFAMGKGEAPRIVIRSGRMSLAQVNEGRSRIAWFLGRAYQSGHIVAKDRQQAQHWYLVSAQKGHTPSQVFLARMLELEGGDSESKEQAYYWFGVAAARRNTLGPAGQQRVAIQLSPDVRQKIDLQIQAFQVQ
jgi:hypothetical protein